MKTTIKIAGLLLFLLTGQIAFGQDNKEKALEKGLEAIQLMDEGKFDESIKLLKQAQKLDPKRYDYPYEMAYAHYAQGDFKGAIKILEKLSDHKDVTDRLFQLLGNAYDVIDNSEKAFEVYDAGLEKFPNSGALYLEKGNVYWGKEEYAEAIPYYEKGIEVDPGFASNYYRAARIYLNSTEEIWGMIYGELFMNIERNTARTAEISEMLFATYESEISFTSDSSIAVSFCQSMTMSIDALSDGKEMVLPFCMIYEPTLLIGIVFEKSLDINSLDRIRNGFIENYFKMGHNKTHPNILFDYQNEILKAGHLASYNHWVLMKGDEDKFDIWVEENEEKWTEFVTWFTDNGLKVNDSNKFYSGQY
jgi:tetratricopeptide (TPR) repeat protein